MAVVLAAGVTIAFSTTMDAQQQRLPIVPVLPTPGPPQDEAPVRPGAKMKRFERGKKISEQFDAAAGDRDVVVERWERDEDAAAPPPGVTDVAWRTIHSAAVAVVTVESVEGFLTENDTWIDSTVTGTVSELIKDVRQTPLQLNGRVSFVTPGGTLKVGDNTLQAITRSAAFRTQEFREGRRYLVFLIERQGGTLFAHPASAFEIVGPKLRPIRPSLGGATKRIADADSDAVIAEAIANRNVPARKGAR
jgi:hypothetical protein